MELNKAQREAAEHVEGPLLVLAGAGSGKTRVVVQRIVHLLSIGIPSSEILALTFTNKAAREMKERLFKLTSFTILTSTFHSLGARILRESISYLGYPLDFTIYDEDDSEKLLKMILTEQQIKDEKGVLKTFQNLISQVKSEWRKPEEVCDDPQFLNIFHSYQQHLKNYGAVDFDDLLYLCLELFQKFPEVLKLYQKRWSFILIDEYQDTNRAQYLLAKMLSHEHNNFFAVGDPDQSIYSWRGANIQHILNFKEDFPNGKIIPLEENYRSTNHILSAASFLISHNQQRFHKSLWSALGPGEKVTYFHSFNDREEVDFILSTLLKHHRKGSVPLNECVIFYRTNSQSRIFEDALLKKKIPYLLVGAVSFYQRKEIKDILSFLRIVHSGSDYLSFARVINLPRRGIGETTLRTLKEGAEKEGLFIFDFCQKQVQNRQALKLKGLAEFVEMILNLREMVEQNISLSTLVKELIAQSRYLEVLRENPDMFEEKKENLDELVSLAATWEVDNGTNLSAFLEELTVRSVHEENKYQDSLKLMTLHHGKGLEFTLVFIAGLEEDLMPHIRAKEEKDVEEERRLFYVGMTRAKRKLYLTSSRIRLLWGTPRTMLPSRFLNELPHEDLEIINESGEKEVKEDVLKEGSTVYHRDFGRGVIQKIYHTSLGITYDILFADKVSRSIVAKFARFTK